MFLIITDFTGRAGNKTEGREATERGGLLKVGLNTLRDYFSATNKVKKKTKNKTKTNK